MKKNLSDRCRQKNYKKRQNDKFFDIQINGEEGDCLGISQDEKDEWLDSKGTALYLKISVKCLHNLTSSGKVKYYKFGKRNRFLKSDLKNLLLANPRGAIYGN